MSDATSSDNETATARRARAGGAEFDAAGSFSPAFAPFARMRRFFGLRRAQASGQYRVTDGEVIRHPVVSVGVVLATAPVVFVLVVLVSLALFGSPAPDNGKKADRLAQTGTGAARAETLAQPQRALSTGASGTVRPTAVSLDTAAAINLPADAAILAMALDGDRLALAIDTPAGQEIAYFNAASGARLAASPVRFQRGAAGERQPARLNSLLFGPSPSQSETSSPDERLRAAGDLAEPRYARGGVVAPSLKSRTSP